jgi:hypothetical protein
MPLAVVSVLPPLWLPPEGIDQLVGAVKVGFERAAMTETRRSPLWVPAGSAGETVVPVVSLTAPTPTSVQVVATSQLLGSGISRYQGSPT